MSWGLTPKPFAWEPIIPPWLFSMHNIYNTMSIELLTTIFSNSFVLLLYYLWWMLLVILFWYLSLLLCFFPCVTMYCLKKLKRKIDGRVTETMILLSTIPANLIHFCYITIQWDLKKCKQLSIMWLCLRRTSLSEVGLRVTPTRHRTT